LTLFACSFDPHYNLKYFFISHYFDFFLVFLLGWFYFFLFTFFVYLEDRVIDFNTFVHINILFFSLNNKKILFFSGQNLINYYTAKIKIIFGLNEIHFYYFL